MNSPTRTTKKRVKLLIDAELLMQARALRLNLSKVFEQSLINAIREKKREKLSDEIR